MAETALPEKGFIFFADNFVMGLLKCESTISICVPSRHPQAAAVYFDKLAGEHIKKTGLDLPSKRRHAIIEWFRP